MPVRHALCDPPAEPSSLSPAVGDQRIADAAADFAMNTRGNVKRAREFDVRLRNEASTDHQDAARDADSHRELHFISSAKEDKRVNEPEPTIVRSVACVTAERLVARSLPTEPAPDAAAAAAEQVFAQLFHSLAQWVGGAGSEALFSRAFVLCGTSHTVCEGVRYRPTGSTPHLERLAENARECGAEATVEGITAVVTSIITMLTGLIGDEEIAMSLLGDGPPPPRRGAPGIVPGITPYKAEGSTGSVDDRRSYPDRRHGHDRRNNR